MILLVLGVSNLYEVIQKHLSNSLIVLNYLEIPIGNIVIVLNNGDLFSQDSISTIMESLDIHSCRNRIIISARTEVNFEVLLKH